MGIAGIFTMGVDFEHDGDDQRERNEEGGQWYFSLRLE